MRWKTSKAAVAALLLAALAGPAGARRPIIVVPPGTGGGGQSAAGVINFPCLITDLTQCEDAFGFIPAPWVTPATHLVCYATGGTLDHPDADDAYAEGVGVAYEITAGVGISIAAHAPALTWGDYAVICSETP